MAIYLFHPFFSQKYLFPKIQPPFPQYSNGGPLTRVYRSLLAGGGGRAGGGRLPIAPGATTGGSPAYNVQHEITASNLPSCSCVTTLPSGCSSHRPVLSMIPMDPSVPPPPLSAPPRGPLSPRGPSAPRCCHDCHIMLFYRIVPLNYCNRALRRLLLHHVFCPRKDVNFTAEGPTTSSVPLGCHRYRSLLV